ncbi:hypothetical protein NUW58_g3325 [Xylaria curta]|uniref:Uncharacterized protein n=1 Tax=Xylaria curta TaxID=42375 RepID=A0ACC1PE82_9PEZI|nr:hypothetical protein NUW58_g3325 [Xylaria curta]
MDREWFLRFRLDDPDREKHIAEEAHWIIDDACEENSGLSCEEKKEWLNIGYVPKGFDLGMDEELFLKIFKAHQSAWANDTDLTKLTRILTYNKTRLRNITKIVCFGLGSLQAIYNNPRYEKAKAEVWRVSCQYATALQLAKLFKEFNGGKEVQVFAQDPTLTLMEINAFPKIGINVVNPHLHQGFALVDQNTFVFSICIDFKAKMEHIIMATSQPAAMIFNPDFRPLGLSKPMQMLKEEYTHVPCTAFKGQWTWHEGHRIEAPLGPKAKLFILKPGNALRPSQTRKRKFQESNTDAREVEGPPEKRVNTNAGGD